MKPRRRQLWYQAPYFARFLVEFLRGRHLPAVGGLSITDRCNLACLHCWRANTGAGHVPYPKVVSAVDELYRRGARYLYIQGGEPCTWTDGAHTLTDVVSRARERGFFHVAVCSNGTFPLVHGPDSYSISIEGDARAHDTIRSGSFATAMANIAESDHPNIFFNATFNNRNSDQLETIARLAADTPKVRGVLVNFHIPYSGVEELSLSHEHRARLADEAIALKRAGFPIMNTLSGLEALGRNDWKRPLDLSVVTDCSSFFSCCRARGDDAVCDQCGYAGWAELAQVLEFDVRATWQLVRKFGRR